MDKEQESSDSPTARETNEGEQSFVGKFKTSVSEIISNTPLSKWFRKQNTTTTPSTIRRRDDDADEDFYELQPPSKRTKLPNEKERLNIDTNDTLPSPISSVTNLNRFNFSHFPEPVAGPSGFSAPGPSGYSSTRKVLNSTSILLRDSFKNGDLTHNEISKVDSDSEASTSGYSSGQLPSKAVSQESSKQASPQDTSPVKTRSLFSNSNAGRNLFSEKSFSPNPNSSLSSRGPSFNVTNVGSPNFVDRTLSTKRILNSPFYSGRTIYGGASAYGKNLGRTNQDLRRALKNSIQIKPVNKDTSSEKCDLQLGKTARRILDTLEQYSTPVLDAKKIPTSPKKPREGILSRYTGANPYMLIRENRTASNRELLVPSVTDLLKMKQDQQKTRLQDSTEAVRQIAKKSKINQETDNSYKIPEPQGPEKHTGKMKSKITSVRQKPQNDEPAPQLKLNPVALPIKEMPKFDIVVPPPADQPAKNVSEAHKPTQSKGLSSEKVTSITGQFKFSAPLVLGTCQHPVKALNNFKFSEPLVKKRRSIHPELDAKDTTTVKNNGENFLKNVSSPSVGASELWECPMCMIRNQSSKVKCVACGAAKTDNSLKKDTKDPPLSSLSTFGDKFKPASNTWECSSCMIRNKEELTRCVACETAKPGVKPSPFKANITGSGFGKAFSQPTNTWECPTCMIRNKDADAKCVACETTKPGAKRDAQTTAPPASNSFSFGVPPATSSFGSKFTPDATTWECPTCMIRNKDADSKCVACETAKPGGKSAAQAKSTSTSSSFSFGVPAATSSFGSKFAPPASTWECPSCMIRNKEEVAKCVACETSRPGGTKASSTVSAVGLKKQDEWECEMCMVRNQSTLNKCQCCESPKPGTSLDTNSAGIDTDKKISGFSFGVDKATASSFTFGVPATMQQTSQNTTSSFTFAPSTSSNTSTSFTFGVPAKDTASAKPTTDTKPKEESKKEETPAPKITFGVSAPIKADTTTDSSKTAEEKQKSEDKPDSAVKMNPLLKPNEKLPEKAKPAAAGFSFGLTASPISKTVSKPDDSGETPAKRKAPSASSTSESPKVPLFNFKPPTTNGEVNKVSPFSNKTKEDSSKPVAPAPSAGFQFSFGAKTGATAAPPATPTSLTNSVAASSAPTEPVKGAMFKFGSASTSETPKSTPPANNGFNFGANKTPTFGASAPTNSSSTEAPKPFGFGATAPISLTTESAKAPNFSFGSSTQPQEPSKAPSFNFGGAASSTTENKPGANSSFSFGSSSTVSSTEPAKPAVFSFGANANKTGSSGFGQSTTPSFGQTATNNNSNVTPSFGQSAPAPSSNLFGQAAATASANPFGSTTSGTPAGGFGQSSSQVSNPFGQSNSTTAPPNAAPFGQSAPAATVFFGGSSTTAPKPQTNGLFNFGSVVHRPGNGSTSGNHNAGLNFHGGNVGSTSQGGFNFGSSATAPTASGGFNFSGSASFDASAKPSFNFSGGAGVQQFTATPSTDPPQQQQPAGARRIKKAIRRTQVR